VNGLLGSVTMRIQHNVSAMFALRQVAINQQLCDKSIRRLSSGYRINSAADDPAGLAISEKMRSQINGLDQATSNANDAISLAQTAEGALNETTSILQRMKELATQASNGTYQNDVDRANIQKEITSLISEIDRISSVTNFNKIGLIDGTTGGYTIKTVAPIDAEISNISVSGGKLANVTAAFTVAVAAGTAGAVTIDALQYSKTGSGSVSATTAVSLSSKTVGKVTTFTAQVDRTLASQEEYEQWNGVQITVTTASIPTFTSVTAIAIDTGAAKGLTFQIGDSANSDQQATVNVGDMSSKGLGVNGVSVATQEQALAAIDTISAAINKVSGTRADLGALQNRLEYTVSNLGTMEENLTSAESRIRDVDMAKEMMELAQHQVLVQAGMAMLAQVNFQPQSILKLLDVKS